VKIAILEKDESQKYHPVPVDQFKQMVKCRRDRIIIYVPNLCGGETKIIIFRSEISNGNQENMTRLRNEH